VGSLGEMKGLRDRGIKKRTRKRKRERERERERGRKRERERENKIKKSVRRESPLKRERYTSQFTPQTYVWLFVNQQWRKTFFWLLNLGIK